jgi:hypothetical protein
MKRRHSRTFRHRAAVAAAVNWARDHGFLRGYPTLDAMIRALAWHLPERDPATLKAEAQEYVIAPDPRRYLLALAPALPPLVEGAMGYGRLDGSLVIVLICPPTYLAQLQVLERRKEENE